MRSKNMGYRRASFLLGLVLLLLTSQKLQAQEDMVLTARPGLCILKDPSMAACIVNVQLNWQAKEAGSFCLHSSTQTEPLHCWRDAKSGEHTAELASKADVKYWMQAADSTRELAPVIVRILSVAQKQPNRHRRRHAWTWL
ncbi:MAG: DUF3019 domain-containing protein [Halioglobus sp.]